jgi:hypothetical protein
MLVHRRYVVLDPTRVIAAHVSPLPITILILLARLLQIGAHAVVNVGGRNTWLDIPYAELDLSATLLVNLTVYEAGGVIEALGERLDDG